MSPFSSFREVAKHLIGNIFSYLIADRFRNIEHIKDVKAPIFLIHGKKDELVPYSHSKDLYKKNSSNCEFWFPGTFE